MNPSHTGLGLAIVCSMAAMLAAYPPSSTAVTQTGISFKDATGHNTIVPVPAKRVVLTSISLPDYLALVGNAKAVVGVSYYNITTVQTSLQRKIFPDAIKVRPIEGSHPLPLLDPEMIIARQPDVSFVFRGIGFTPALEKIGVPGLVEFPAGTISPTEQSLRSWRYTAIVSGQTNRGHALLDRYYRANNEIGAAAPRLRQPIKVVSLFTTPFATLMDSKGNILEDAYKLLHLSNPLLVDKKWAEPFDLERLLLAGPDIILFDQTRGIGDQQKVQQFFARPEMQALRAVRERRIYRVPSEAFSDEIVDGPLMRRWLAEIVYPYAYAPLLREKMRTTYQEIYGYTPTDEDIDTALLIEDNKNSRGYERFIAKGEE